MLFSTLSDSIKVVIHNIDIQSQSATISITDCDIWMIIDNKNITIKLNEEKNAIDEEWFGEYIKKIVFTERLARLERLEKDII